MRKAVTEAGIKIDRNAKTPGPLDLIGQCGKSHFPTLLYVTGLQLKKKKIMGVLNKKWGRRGWFGCTTLVLLGASSTAVRTTGEVKALFFGVFEKQM
jgi:hypothetical protein